VDGDGDSVAFRLNAQVGGLLAAGGGGKVSILGCHSDSPYFCMQL